MFLSIIMKKSFEQIPFNPARWPFFYGWMILFWGIVGFVLSVPGQTTGVSAFIEPLIKDLGISRTSLGDAYLIGTLSSSFLLTPFGKLYDRIGSRWMGCGSCIFLGFVLFLLSCTDRMATAMTPWIPYPKAIFGLLALLFFLLRLSGQGILTMASRNMMMKWFDVKRGLISGISGAAISFGFSCTPSIFSEMITVRGWSGTWHFLSLLLIFVFAPLLLLFFRDTPEASGLVPDGNVQPSKVRKKAEVHRSFTLPEARRTFCFWAFALAMALQALILTATTFHIESIFENADMLGAQGFELFKPIAMVSIVATLLAGWLGDRIQLRPLFSIMMAAMALNLTGLIFLKPGWPIACMILGGGIATGLFSLLMSITWPRYFGRKHLGAISGLSMSMVVIFSAIGPALYGRIFSLTGNYIPAHLVGLTIVAILFSSSFFARNPQLNSANP